MYSWPLSRGFFPTAVSLRRSTALGIGYARGADLHHLACALFAAESPRDLPFLTLDTSQGALASKLGFPG